MDYTETILEILTLFLEYEKQSKEATAPFKVKAYSTAIAEVRNYGKPIVTKEDVDSIPKIGKKIRQKLYEIIETGTVKEIEEKGINKVSEIHKALTKVYGIGNVKADNLINEFGIETIEDLMVLSLDNPYILTDAQKLGLKYYYDLIQRIPRSEMLEHERFLREFYLSIAPEFNLVVVGSYRRGLETSGDIDILLSYNGISYDKAIKYFRDSIEALTESQYIVGSLGVGKLKYMGICQLDESLPARRLDILLTKPEELACALLYFTGSQDFNVEFRKVAISQGYTLNEHALTKINPESDVPQPPPFRTEKDVFDFLGLEFQYPNERVKDVINM
jgi:DNA polymerase beta